MPMKKRSLKDIASAPLVHKSESGPTREVASPGAAKAVGGRPRSRSARRENSPRMRPAALPDETRPGAAPAVATVPAKKARSPYRSLWRIAASIVVGFIGGIFFGRFIKI